MSKYTLKLIAIAFLSLFPAVLFAQETQDEDPYKALALAVSSDDIAMLRFEQDMKVSFYPGLKQFPDLVQLDKDCPGFMLGFGKALTPVMLLGHMEDNAWYQRKLEALFRDRLSAEDTAKAAEFYGSETGQRLLARAIANMSATNTVAEVVGSEDDDLTVSREAYDADRQASLNGLLRDLGKEELERIGRSLIGQAWFPRFRAILPEIQTLGHELLNRDYSPSINSKIEAVSQTFTEKHIAACEAYQE